MFSGQPEPGGATDKRVNAAELLEVLYSQKSRPSIRWLRKMTTDGIIPVERHGRMVFYVPSQVVAALNRYGRFQEQERKKRKAVKADAETRSEADRNLAQSRGEAQ